FIKEKKVLSVHFKAKILYNVKQSIYFCTYIQVIKVIFIKERYSMTATKGLEGIVATESSISSIINDKLTYCGYSIDDLAAKSSSEEMEIPDAILTHLRSYDLSTVHPMAALRTAISLLGLYDEEADVMDKDANLRKAIRLQAKVSTIVTAFSRIRQGKDPVAPKKD